MPDPDDFPDKNEPEGEIGGNPKAGQEGVGGLTTEEAEDAYKNAAEQHFDDSVTPGNKTNPPNEKKK